MRRDESPPLPVQACADRLGENTCRLGFQLLQQTLVLFLTFEFAVERNQLYAPPHCWCVISYDRLVIESQPDLMRWFEGNEFFVEGTRCNTIATGECLDALFAKAHGLPRFDCGNETAVFQSHEIIGNGATLF